MGIAITAPLALLLFPLLLGLTLALHLGARRRLGVARRRIALLVRALMLAALVLALAGLQLGLPVDRLSTVFVVDMSDSVGPAGREDALTFIRQALAAMPEGDQAGIVAFGRDALVERLPEDLREVDRLASTPVTNATDLGAALRLAAAVFPDDTGRRIVLLSDGNDTTGSAETEAALAAARGIQVETRTIGISGGPEVLVERLTTPSTAHVGEQITAAVEIRSTVAQPATVRLFADGAEVGRRALQLAAGTTPIMFDAKVTEPGFHTFRAVVDAARDTFSQNNRADSDTIVQGEPRILVVAGDQGVARELVRALASEKRSVDEVAPEAVPDLTGLASYDSLVLVNVPRTRLTDQQLSEIQVYVRDLGRGLVMVGGTESFGAGGYRDTPVEEALPVEMGVRDRTKQPDVALVVVIDQSGSMDACHCNGPNRANAAQIQGVRKVDIGKEAILRAAAALNPTDELGVVGFNEAAHWVVHTEPLSTIPDLQGAISAIQPNGQTNIMSGLEQAVSSLEQSGPTRRHIILLTDGWSTSGDYAAILARMKAAGITLSTVGAGGGAAPILQQLAQQGGGRFYAAANPARIPDIFLKETQQVSGRQIVEETFHPILTSSSPILRGLEGGLPQLLGYDGTTPKAAAQVPLVTARDDPLLAQWQYGLGRAAAWTSDTTGRWAKAWVGWNSYARFVNQLVAWTFPGEETGGIEASFVTVEQADARGTSLRVESVASDGNPRDFYSTSAMLVGPSLQSVKVDLPQTAPGIYEAPLGELDPGAYAIRITQTKPDAPALGRTLGLVAPGAAEYRMLGANEPVLASLRAATGGSVASLPADAWRHDVAGANRMTDLWPPLLVLALLLWPLDVGLRRVSIGRRELAAARAWPGAWLARRGSRRGPAVALDQVLQARRSPGRRTARDALHRGGTADAMGGPTGPSTTAPVAPAADATPAPAVPAAPVGGGVGAGDSVATVAKLRDAKRRARGD